MRAMGMLAKAEGSARSELLYGSASRFIVAYPAGSGVAERLADMWVDGSGTPTDAVHAYPVPLTQPGQGSGHHLAFQLLLRRAALRKARARP